MFKEKKEKKEETAMAKVEEKPQELSKFGNLYEGYTPEEMAELGGTTGAEDLPPEERRHSLYSWNLKIMTEDGKVTREDQFYDGLTGEQFESVHCAFIGFKRTNMKVFRNKETGQKQILCQSNDRIEGFDPETGVVRSCEKCPDKASKQGQKRNCTSILRFMAWDLEHRKPFIVNFKSSSYVPASNYLDKNFLGQLKTPDGKRRDIPLYMMGTKITLTPEQGDESVYYVPKFECTGPLPKATVLDLLPSAQAFKQMNLRELAVDEQKAKPQDKVVGEAGGDQDIPF